MEEVGISGPFFVSIGTPEKLQRFLELNPAVPRDKSFVDDYKFEAYKGVGLKTWMITSAEDRAKLKFVMPNFSWKDWWSYLTNVAAISPVNPNASRLEIPEGVLRLGATFVVSDDEVVFQWTDRRPGDHPNIDEVLAVAKEVLTGA